MCEKHGRLYTFAAIVDSAGLLGDAAKGCGYQMMCNLGRNVQGICPDGWRIPNYDEYTTLIEVMGDEGIAGRNLKAVEYGGTDSVGFSLLISGRHIEFERMSDPESESLYDFMDNAANYWTITESTSDAVLAYRFFADYDYVGQDMCSKYIAHPLRCVKGEASRLAPGQFAPSTCAMRPTVRPFATITLRKTALSTACSTRRLIRKIPRKTGISRVTAPMVGACRPTMNGKTCSKQLAEGMLPAICSSRRKAGKKGCGLAETE